MQQKNTIIDILTMEKGSFPWWPSWFFFCGVISLYIYIYIFLEILAKHNQQQRRQ
jgi:hypothetical protein